MITKINSFHLAGAEAQQVTIETQVTPGIGIHITGLSDNSLKETLLRTITALRACGYSIPRKKIVINILPAIKHNLYCGLDLPIALGLLQASGQEEMTDLDRTFAWGELFLDGTIRPVPGAVQANRLYQQTLSGKRLILAREDAAGLCEAGLAGPVFDSGVFAAATLRDAVNAAKGQAKPAWEEFSKKEFDVPYPESLPTSGVLRALETAAAGRHDILVADPSCDTVEMAYVIDTLSGEMNFTQAQETAAAYSALGKPKDFHKMGSYRPIRIAHPSASISSMLGGGTPPRPGELALAHNGTLVLIEIETWPKVVLEALVGAMEDKKITLHRLDGKHCFPADSLVIAAMGGQDHPERIPGLVYDLLGIQIIEDSGEKATRDDLECAAWRVMSAKKRQSDRNPFGVPNSRLSPQDLTALCCMDKATEEHLDSIMLSNNLRICTRTQILRIARTIADLEGKNRVTAEHLDEALSYRTLDIKTQQKDQ